MPQKVASQKSELGRLLEKNAYTKKGLNPEEIKRARELIEKPEYSGENCWVCEMVGRNDESYQIDSAIYDTGMCQGQCKICLIYKKIILLLV
jgi:hypothetical protein